MLNETKQLVMIEVNQLKCVIDKILASLLNRIKVMFSLSLLCVLGGCPYIFLSSIFTPGTKSTLIFLYEVKYSSQ